MKSKEILMHTYYMYQFYVIFLLGIFYPVCNIDLSYSLIASAIGYLVVCFVKEKQRKITIGTMAIGLAIFSWLSQHELIPRIVMIVYYTLLLISYYRDRSLKSIQPTIIIVTLISVIILSSSLNYFTKTHDDISIVYNSLLAYFVVGLFASAVYNMDVFYKLSFVNVLDNSSREVIENIVLAISVVTLILHRHLFNIVTDCLLIFGLIVLYVLSFLIRGIAYIFGLLFVAVVHFFPNLFQPNYMDDFIESLNNVSNAFGDTAEYVHQATSGGDSIDILAKILVFLFLATAVAIVVGLIKNRKEESLQLSSAGVTTTKSLITDREGNKKKNKKRFSSNMTEIRRKYKKTAKRLIRKHYDFPEHITANEYLSTIKDSDIEQYDFEQLTQLYNEDRYGSL